MFQHINQLPSYTDSLGVVYTVYDLYDTSFRTMLYARGKSRHHLIPKLIEAYDGCQESIIADNVARYYLWSLKTQDLKSIMYWSEEDVCLIDAIYPSTKYQQRYKCIKNRILSLAWSKGKR
jgi:hypothetical protein